MCADSALPWVVTVFSLVALRDSILRGVEVDMIHNCSWSAGLETFWAIGVGVVSA